MENCHTEYQQKVELIEAQAEYDLAKDSISTNRLLISTFGFAVAITALFISQLGAPPEDPVSTVSRTVNWVLIVVVSLVGLIVWYRTKTTSREAKRKLVAIQIRRAEEARARCLEAQGADGVS